MGAIITNHKILDRYDGADKEIRLKRLSENAENIIYGIINEESNKDKTFHFDVEYDIENLKVKVNEVK